jgi:hypothetical protein
MHLVPQPHLPTDTLYMDSIYMHYPLSPTTSAIHLCLLPHPSTFIHYLTHCTYTDYLINTITSTTSTSPTCICTILISYMHSIFHAPINVPHPSTYGDYLTHPLTLTTSAIHLHPLLHPPTYTYYLMYSLTQTTPPPLICMHQHFSHPITPIISPTHLHLLPHSPTYSHCLTHSLRPPTHTTT